MNKKREKDSYLESHAINFMFCKEYRIIDIHYLREGIFDDF